MKAPCPEDRARFREADSAGSRALKKHGLEKNFRDALIVELRIDAQRTSPLD
jgi:hypothetical protein